MQKFSTEDDDGYFPPGTVHEDEFFSASGLNFVWDKPKSERNLMRKGFSFKTAALIFNDAYCVYDEDVSHSIGERRSWAMGFPVMDPQVQDQGFQDERFEFMNDILFVVFTERMTWEGKEYIRIISSRLATKEEIDEYYRKKNNIL